MLVFKKLQITNIPYITNDIILIAKFPGFTYTMRPINKKNPTKNND